MKTKTSIILAIVAIATASFTFTSLGKYSKTDSKTETEHNSKRAFDEPAGGFVTEDKF